MKAKELIGEITGEASSLKTDFRELSKIRVELLKVEASELAESIKNKLVSAVILVGSLFFTFAVLLAASIAALGTVLKPYLTDALQPYSWQLVAGGVLLIFLLIILASLKALRTKPTAPFFFQSKLELLNDKLWLQNLLQKKNKH